MLTYVVFTLENKCYMLKFFRNSTKKQSAYAKTYLIVVEHAWHLNEYSTMLLHCQYNYDWHILFGLGYNLQMGFFRDLFFEQKWKEKSLEETPTIKSGLRTLLWQLSKDYRAHKRMTLNKRLPVQTGLNSIETEGGANELLTFFWPANWCFESAKCCQSSRLPARKTSAECDFQVCYCAGQNVLA